MNALQPLTECKKLLECHHELLSDVIGMEKPAYNPPEIAMTRAFEFGKRLLDAIKAILRNREHAIFAVTLCRPFYELSNRLLWASREKDGWQRFVQHYAHEEDKWAKEARELPIDKWPNTAAHAHIIHDEKLEVLGQGHSERKSYEKVPSMQEILRQIEERDIVDGLREESNNKRSEEYTMVYRPVCRVSHAHIVAIGDEVRPDTHLKTLVAAVALATLALIRACYFYRANNNQSEVESACKRIQDIIDACPNLNFDENA